MGRQAWCNPVRSSSNSASLSQSSITERVAVRPCLNEFKLALAFPALDRGPVDFFAFFLFATAFFSLTMIRLPPQR